MTSVTKRVDFENPWLYGVLTFVVYVAAQLFAGWLFRDGFTDVHALVLLGGAFTFAGVATGLRVILNRYAMPS